MTQMHTKPAPRPPPWALPMLHIKVKILRFDPEKDRKAHWETYAIEAQAGDRVLDVINEVKWYQTPA